VATDPADTDQMVSTSGSLLASTGYRSTPKAQSVARATGQRHPTRALRYLPPFFGVRLPGCGVTRLSCR
jgi:hypothetical protein